MLRTRLNPLVAGVFAVVCVAGALMRLPAQPAGQSGGMGQAFFTAADTDKNGSLSPEEFRTAITSWLAQGDTGKTGYLTEEQFATVVSAAFPQPRMAAPVVSPNSGRGSAEQPQTAKPEDIRKMMAALPAKYMVKPAKARKILVLSKARSFVHSCIPLVGNTIEAMGTKTGAWTTTVSYDASVITEENLKQYDVLVLNNTTGAFLDEPGNPAVHEARKQALLNFVRSGKGLVGIHAASDSYHESAPAPAQAAPAGGRGAARGGMGGMVANGMMALADTNSDKKVTAAELRGLADSLFAKLDTAHTGRVTQQDLQSRLLTAFSVGGSRGGRQGRDTQVGTWPEFNRLVGGYFKWHWMFPTHIVYKIDDPDSPLTTMFRGSQYSLDDETYTFGINSWSRQNLHVLTSVEYSAMSEADKLKEDYPREDHDYGLSWIRREGKGRVFYEAHGHDEGIYADRTMLLHILAGVQYAAGDLKANDAPSKR
jgi:type 1 glutamine amidotransferase